MTSGNKHIIYFLGIGGIGMSALARWFNIKNLNVSGYDKTPSSVTSAIIGEGIKVNFNDDINSIPEEVKQNKDKCLVVKTPAIPDKSKQLNYFLENGYSIRKRSEILGDITCDLFTIAVAGTHGKTSTSSLITHLFKEAGLSFVSFLGGIPVNYQSNMIVNGDIKEIDLSVVEADEFDRSFHRLHPNHAVVTSADPDHLDIYGDYERMKDGFRDFINLLPTGGNLLINEKVADALIPENRSDLSILQYGLESGDIRAGNISLSENKSVFDYSAPGIKLSELSIPFPGYHNIENTLAAIHIALSQGISEGDLINGMNSYKGIKRRFEYQIRRDDLVFIDDYAHHPEEIRAFLQSIKAMYPDKPVTAIFQPHLFTRTRDFRHDFADSMDLADQVILLDIYPAREEPIEGVDSSLIFNLLKCKDKLLLDKEQLLDNVDRINNRIVVTIGAGDIDRLVMPIKEKLEEK